MKNDLPIRAVDVRAIDVGYDGTKYTTGRCPTSNSIVAASFPSLAPRIASTQQVDGSGQRSRGVLIGVRGVDYFVGPDAPLQAAGSEPRPVDPDYCMADRYYALSLGALNDMAAADGAGVDYVIRHLVLGLPLTTFGQHKRALAAKMTGSHEVKSTSGQLVRRVLVEHVTVLVQPVGALMSLNSASAHDGMNVVIDAGGGTFDWLVTNGLKVNWSRSGSHPKAMRHCAMAVADGINKSWRNKYEIMDAIDKALRTGGSSFHVGAREYQLAPHRAAVEAVLEESVTTMLGSTDSLDSAGTIIFAGGGAPLFFKYMAAKFPHLTHAMVADPNPVYSNVYGFHLGGESALVRN